MTFRGRTLFRLGCDNHAIRLQIVQLRILSEPIPGKVGAADDAERTLAPHKDVALRMQKDVLSILVFGVFIHLYPPRANLDLLAVVVRLRVLTVCQQQIYGRLVFLFDI